MGIRVRNAAMYLCPIFYIASVYGSIMLFFITADKETDSDTSTMLPCLCLLLPLCMIGINMFILYNKHGQLSRIYYLNSTVIIKYSLIPLYVVGGICILLLAVVMVVPALLFLSPFLIGVLCMFGWIYLAGGMLFSMPYLSRSAKAGVHNKVIIILAMICQVFFFMDVVSIMYLALKEKRCIKSTILVFLFFALSIAAVILAIYKANAAAS